MRESACIILGLVILLCAGQADAGKVTDKLDLHFSERVRLVTWDNTISLDNSANEARTFTRHRTYLGATWKPSEVIQLRFQLGNEFRYYFVPTTVDFTWNEIFVDQFYIKLIKPGNLPLTATLGRQNIILGEGFVVMDGGPLDGSRSIYFNAVRLDWDLGKKWTLTTFGMYQDETDDFLPVFNEQNQAMLEQPELGLGAYFTTPLGNAKLDLYYIFKRADSSEVIPITSNIHTLGGKIDTELGSGFRGVLEGAFQFGDRGEYSRTAFGGHGYCDLKVAREDQFVAVPQKVRLGGIYLGGDDPATSDYEGWDPVFARWPKWSESYIYTQLREDGVAWWTDLASLYLGSSWQFSEEVQFQADFHHLMAPYNNFDSFDYRETAGNTRGDLLIGKLSYSFDQNWSGHVLWESFIPGDFYPPGADNYTWLRTELMFKF